MQRNNTGLYIFIIASSVITTVLLVFFGIKFFNREEEPIDEPEISSQEDIEPKEKFCLGEEIDDSKLTDYTNKTSMSFDVEYGDYQNRQTLTLTIRVGFDGDMQLSNNKTTNYLKYDIEGKGKYLEYVYVNGTYQFAVITENKRIFMSPKLSEVPGNAKTAAEVINFYRDKFHFVIVRSNYDFRELTHLAIDGSSEKLYGQNVRGETRELIECEG